MLRKLVRLFLLHFQLNQPKVILCNTLARFLSLSHFLSSCWSNALPILRSVCTFSATSQVASLNACWKSMQSSLKHFSTLFVKCLLGSSIVQETLLCLLQAKGSFLFSILQAMVLVSSLGHQRLQQDCQLFVSFLRQFHHWLQQRILLYWKLCSDCFVLQ